MSDAIQKAAAIKVKMLWPDFNMIDLFRSEIGRLLIEKARHSSLTVNDAVPHLEVDVEIIEPGERFISPREPHFKPGKLCPLILPRLASNSGREARSGLV